MRIDSLSVQMRPRAAHEAADLGIRLCQATARSVYSCYLLVAVPTGLVALSLFEIAPWLPMFSLWLAKPWLDRTVLFVLARAAFGQSTTVGDLWREQRAVLWRQLIISWTWRRLSPWRSFSQPVYQLEGLPFFQLRGRIVQLRRRYGGAALAMTQAFFWAQNGLMFALVSLVYWFAPAEQNFELSQLFTDAGSQVAQLTLSIAYFLTVLFLEPFYVAAGFGMYLNRRAELEAWDIEQEFRRAFA